MNIEEAKAFLEANGYYVSEKKPFPKFLPCVCGKSRRWEWLYGDGYEYQCKYCDFQGGKGKTRREAIEKWNDAVTSARVVENDADQ